MVRALHAVGLVYTYVLLIHPITLGSGTRLFGEADRRGLRLERSVATTTGVIIAKHAVGTESQIHRPRVVGRVPNSGRGRRVGGDDAVGTEPARTLP